MGFEWLSPRSSLQQWIWTRKIMEAWPDEKMSVVWSAGFKIGQQYSKFCTILVLECLYSTSSSFLMRMPNGYPG